MVIHLVIKLSDCATESEMVTNLNTVVFVIRNMINTTFLALDVVILIICLKTSTMTHEIEIERKK